MDTIASFVINIAPGLSVPELQKIADDLGVRAFVVNNASVGVSDVPTLRGALLEGNGIIVFMKLRSGKDASEINPDGHFIALVATGPDSLEIYDPAGDNVEIYLKMSPWMRSLASAFDNVTQFSDATQPAGSNSCGPWSLIRVAMKDMPKKLFMRNVDKAGRSRKMAKVTKAHTHEAFGPIGREAPHMSQLKAQHYGELLSDHSNMNLPAAKHVAHIINRSVTHNPEVAASKVSDVVDELKQAIPHLEFSDKFMQDFGSAKAHHFNEFAKSLKKVRAPKSVAEHSIKKAVAQAYAGSSLGGSSLGGSSLAGSSLGGSSVEQTCGGARPALTRLDVALGGSCCGGMPSPIVQTPKPKKAKKSMMKTKGMMLGGGKTKAQSTHSKAQKTTLLEAMMS